MTLLIKIAELVVVFFVIRSLLRIRKPSGERKKPETTSNGQQPKRFETGSRDISDGDYEEL